MARKRDRAFAAFGAALFLITSSALTIAVIIALVDQGKQSDTPDNAASTTATTKDNQPKVTGTKMQNFTPLTQPLAKLEATDTVVGTGAEVKAGDTVTVDYVGALASDGTVFDASADHGGPVPLSLSQVIAGWSQGIPGMKVGGTRRLLIPANLAYGPQAQQGIPANSDLVFDVTVHKIGQ